MTRILTLFVILSMSSIANAIGGPICDQQINKFPSDEVKKLATAVDEVVSRSFKPIMAISINHAGTGDISILVDNNGEISAVRFKYRDGEKSKDFTISIAELNRGKSLQYTSEVKGKPSPLRLSAIIPPGITSAGGNFKLDLATNLDPLKLQPFVLILNKKNNDWKLDYKNREVKKATLSPGISFFSWDGTFQGAEFN